MGTANDGDDVIVCLWSPLFLVHLVIARFLTLMSGCCLILVLVGYLWLILPTFAPLIKSRYYPLVLLGQLDFIQLFGHVTAL